MPSDKGALAMAEVLQGFISDRDFNHAFKLLTTLVMVELTGDIVI